MNSTNYQKTFFLLSFIEGVTQIASQYEQHYGRHQHCCNGVCFGFARINQSVQTCRQIRKMTVHHFSV